MKRIDKSGRDVTDLPGLWDESDAFTMDINMDIKCPFCGEMGFDLIGLKGHLIHGDCVVYESLKAPRRVFF